jgi:hypothetical protein
MRAPGLLGLTLAGVLAAAGCRSDVELGPRDASGDLTGCIPGGPECNNCIDDDGDGLIDGADPHCTGPLDDREDSFATGIPGDNVDAVKQDCFFDGNSGHGDDGCDLHICCLLDQCPPELSSPPFFPDRCSVTQACIDNCAPLSPPGCDCFGCCTICDPETNDCYDVLTHPAVAPDCALGVISDPDKCPRCVKNAECNGGGCEPDGCILCPGQTEEDLPPECNDMNQCPGGRTPCSTSADCADNQYCSSRCCLAVVE